MSNTRTTREAPTDALMLFALITLVMLAVVAVAFGVAVVSGGV